jgi:periplasmic mercuric ion binding protein
MTINQDHQAADTRRWQGLMAAGGLLGALVASSCCILPLALFGLGISGAWIGNFTRLAPYQPCVIGATIAFPRYQTGLSRPGSSSQRSLWLPHLALTSLRPCSSTRERRLPMTKFLACAAFAVGVVASPATFAAEKTITLAVKNMYCADCPFIVKKSLEGLPGVAKVTVSYKDKTATVTYDDNKADVEGLTAATTNAGYPSAPKS